MDIPLRRRLSSAAKKTIVIIVTLMLALTAVFTLKQPAHAASQGAGYGTWDDRVGWQGGFVAPDGTVVYCIEPGVSNPSGSSTSAGHQGSVVSRSPYGDRALSADDLARINYLVSSFGQTSNNREASAVNFAVKYIANPNAMFRSHSWNGSWNLPGYVNWVLYSEVGSTEAAAIAARAEALIDASAGITAGTGVDGSGALTFQVDPFNNYDGTVTMVGTAGATGTVTLTNGVFDTTGTATLSGMQANVPYAITGVPPSWDGKPYSISGTGSFTLGGSGWAGSVHLWHTASQQTTAGPGPRATSQFAVTGADPTERTVTFQPVVTTTAAGYVQPGEHATDMLRFHTVAGETGLNNAWPQTGNAQYRVVRADGTLYGPFAAQPAESADVPDDAPVAAHAQVKTTPVDGPTVEYTATSDATVETAGYYTWVWTIAYDDQSAATRMYLPDGYTFTDHFGQTVESSIVPMQFTVTTAVTSPDVLLSGPAADTATVTAEGLWLQQDGENIPVVGRWDAYYDARPAADIVRVPGTEVPDEAVHLGTRTGTLTGNGTVNTPTTLPDGAVQVPAAGKGSIVWVFSILRDDQGANAEYVTDIVDDYGVPSEISTIVQPEVVTKASAGARIGESISDTAVITGHLPHNGAELTFDLYRVPLVEGTGEVDAPSVDGDGAPVSYAPGDLSWVCTADNLVSSNADTGGAIVTETGEYRSHEYEIVENGKYLWVEKLWSVPAVGKERELIREGGCGVAEETSFALDVTTQAMSDTGATTGIEHGVHVWDTATLTGYVPEGGQVTFEAHLVPARAGVDLRTACTADTLAWTSSPVSLEGGFYDETTPLKVESERHTFDPDVDSVLYFVAVTRDALDREVNRGECGDPNETLSLKGQKVIATGGELSPVAVTAAGVTALLAGLGVLLVARRRVRR
ncbi:hypothetical protein [Microbacterium sp. Leaf320]|uniref:hypothetical protein n=1 Tax=Microbacterium sp. Leaf320 TaxID=1736334 RepID=UPI0012FB7D14|nr:hypothetical protein [Microbacterium sp. Leaf320]